VFGWFTFVEVTSRRSCCSYWERRR